MSRITYFVDLIIPLAVPNLYTYRVPFEENLKISVGKRVVVPFGKNKLYTAIIKKIHVTPPKTYEAKYIDIVIDEYPIVNTFQLDFWDWLSNYYMCTLGEIMIAALPNGFRLTSESIVVLNKSTNYNNPEYDFSENEHLVIDALEIQKKLTLENVGNIVEKKSVYSVLQSLIKKEVIIIHEELKEKYKPKTEIYLKLSIEYEIEENLKKLFNSLEKKAIAQLNILITYLNLSNWHFKRNNEVKKVDIIKLCPLSEKTIEVLIKKRIFEKIKRKVDRNEFFENNIIEFELNEIQKRVLNSIRNQFGVANKEVINETKLIENHSRTNSEKDVVLLHGVTSSGKTEIYCKLIKDFISQGKQVLYLVPEIALTTQIINRLRKFFGNSLGVYHSKFNENERVETWNAILNFNNTTIVQNEREQKFKKCNLIIGARSSIFLPFSNLGLVIIDEEHDSSFKQFDPSPRYNARDAAIYLAQLHKAKTLLGSATPCLESYYNAQERKYGFVEIQERFGGLQMPEIVIADVKEEKKKKTMKSHFSSILIDQISTSLKINEQIILFQNRRGFAPQIECKICSWVPHCRDCDVSLTFHKTTNQLRCHYCGYSINPPSKCNACGDTSLHMKGFGTEKIEEELSLFFPNTNIARMDVDSTRSKFAHQHLIRDFEEKKINILVGTQMITKGLDFDNVGLVGILNADNLLNYPDFRSFERSYQLMTQVAGRSGRKNKRGKVVIQTHNPNHEIIQDVISNNYKSMYINQLLDRKNFHYPPFYKLIEITLVHQKIDLVNNSSKNLADKLRIHFGNRILGPEFPLVAKIRNLFHKTIILKIEREASFFKVKNKLNDLIIEFKSRDAFKTVKIKIDIDPM